MTTEKKTKVVLEAELKGFDKGKREIKETFAAMTPDAVTKGFKQLDFQMGQLFRQVRGLTDGLKAANQEVRGMGKGGGEAFKGMADDIRKMTEAMEKFTATKKKDADEDERRARKRGFAMGVAQGMGVGEYFPEKGFRANLAGRFAGQMGRAGASGMVGGAFSGSQGIAQGLSGIPVVGPFLAAQFSNLLGNAEMGLGYEQAAGGLRQFQTGGALAATSESARLGQKDPGWFMRRNFDDLTSGSAKFGLNAIDAANVMSAFMHARGGSIDDLGGAAQSSERARSVMALNAMGATPDVAGAFGRAERLGTLGGITVPDDMSGAATMRGMQDLGAVQNVMATAIRIGFSSSDAAKYLADMAGVLSEMTDSGIPLAVGSVAALAENFAQRGFSPERAAKLSMSMQQAGRGIFESGGPQSGMQFHAFRTLFGYGQDGFGADAMWDSMKKSASGSFDGEGLSRFVEPFMSGLSTKGGRAVALHGAFKKLGISMAPEEIEAIAGAPSGDFRKRMEDFAQRRGPRSDLDLEALGSAMTPGSVQFAKGTDNLRIGAGRGDTLTAVQEFERAQAQTVNNLAKFSPAIEKLSSMMVDVTKSGGKLDTIIGVLADIASKVSGASK